MDNLSHYYAVLGLKTGASLQEVKMAYRCQVKTWHPDRFAHDPQRQSQGQKRMQEINAAYSLLKTVAPVSPHNRVFDGKWDDLYSIGVSGIDDQHKSFFKMLNNFNTDVVFSSIKTTDDKDMMKIYLYVLNLRRYALNHFLSEEEYMVKYNYPNIFEHRKKHDNFIKRIFALEENYYNFNKLSPDNINDFISSWLADHIIRMDKDFGQYLKDQIDSLFMV
ncbi:MAG: hypothetical protein C4567_10385 [Deltaproteobacteria bacterium]|nr:MAG: hypothetical protein C4567_10385 [Deltaproteobacteria bacterium]